MHTYTQDENAFIPFHTPATKKNKKENPKDEQLGNWPRERRKTEQN
jgi:hypothetical protein